MVDGIEITEGPTRLFVPEVHSVHGPGKITGSVFFNEQMAFNRDISVMFLKTLQKDMTVADAMTATGSRAVRIANEVPGTTVTANDYSADTMEFINRNIELNNLDNCVASNKNMHVLFSESSFDYVDVDPFGSPAPFTQSAIRGCRRKGILAITATDTAPLAGANRIKCERRYQSRPLRGSMCHEMGLRVLMGSIARELAKFDRGMEPMLSFSADHYYRTYVRVTEGADAADASLAKLTYISFDRETLERHTSDKPGGDFVYGPFWGANLHDKETLAKMSTENIAMEKRCDKVLNIWRQEYDNTPFTYDISELSSHTKLSPPKLEVLIAALNESGIASKTHTSPTSFKTDLNLKEILSIYKEVSPDSKL